MTSMEREPSTPLVDEPCLACGKTMFRKGSRDAEGDHWGMHVEDTITLDLDGVDHYYECPHCNAHNVVMTAGRPVDGR